MKPLSEKIEKPTLLRTELHNPFPGLRPFTMKESHLFFGREGQSDEVLVKLSQNRFVGVIGPSGSGKSSFVYCGILPILYGGFLTDVGAEWEVVVAKPGGTPINNLSESILRSLSEYNTLNKEDKKVKKTIISTLLNSSSLGLVEAVQQLSKSKGRNYLILIDQFEELFWHEKSAQSGLKDETLAFIDLLMEAAKYEDCPIYVAITMRSDFIGECSRFAELTHKLNDSHYLIPQMTRNQKQKAIEGPLAVNGVQASPRLIQRLLNDLGNNPDQLPILQHAMMRTWEYWTKYADYEIDPLIDLKHYEAIGGMEGALSLHANEAFNELDEEQRRICEIVFKSITEKRGENSGVRRPTPLKEIVAIANAPEENVIEVINRFREQGRSLVTPAHGIALQANSMIDISHESLMRIWGRLKSWVDDEAEAAQMYMRLAEAAQMYQAGKAGLWRPPDLQLALNWLAKYKPTLAWGQRYHPAFERTMVFLEYSQKEFETEQRAKEVEQKRKLARAKITAIIFGSLMVVALLFLVYAIYQQTEAKKQEQIAKENAQEVIRQRDQARLATTEAKLQRDNAEEARKVAETQTQLAQYRLEQAQYLQGVADKQRKLALENADQAKENAIQAQRNAKRANEQRNIAEQKEKEARIARYLAQSKAMALKSRELSSNHELMALVAQQAYNFNAENEGYAYDKDVYNGLFYALKNYQHPITQSLESHKKGAARALASVAGSEHIYSGGSDGSIIKWSYQNRQWIINEIVGERANNAIFSLDVDPTESYMVAGGLYSSEIDGNQAEIYDLSNFEAGPTKQIGGYTSNIRNIQFTPDGKGFYAWNNSGYRISYYQLDWDEPTAKEVIATKEKISSIRLSPDGKKIAGAGSEGNLYIWDIEDNYSATKTTVSDQYLSAVAFSPNGSQLFVGDINGMIHIVDSGLVVRELSGHTAIIESLKFNYAGTFIASSSKDSKVRLWDYNNLREQPITLDNQDWVWDVAFLPNDEELMVGINSTKDNLNSIDYSVRVWPTGTKELSEIICNLVTRNMTQDEWEIFVGKDLKYEPTCPNLPLNNDNGKNENSEK